MRKILLSILLTGLLFTFCSKDKKDDPAEDSVEYFSANLKANMKYDEFVNLFGKPDGDLGSGIHIYFYTLGDGSMIYIGYTNKIEYARHVGANGQLLHTII